MFIMLFKLLLALLRKEAYWQGSDCSHFEFHTRNLSPSLINLKLYFQACQQKEKYQLRKSDWILLPFLVLCISWPLWVNLVGLTFGFIESIIKSGIQNMQPQCSRGRKPPEGTLALVLAPNCVRHHGFICWLGRGINRGLFRELDYSAGLKRESIYQLLWNDYYRWVDMH